MAFPGNGGIWQLVTADEYIYAVDLDGLMYRIGLKDGSSVLMRLGDGDTVGNGELGFDQESNDIVVYGLKNKLRIVRRYHVER